MTPEAQRIAIAEACGWTVHHGGRYLRIPGWNELSDPLVDLNAMHEAEKVLLKPEQQHEYWKYLETCDKNYYGICFTTAAQRAEAFLKTLGLWKEEAKVEATVEGLR